MSNLMKILPLRKGQNLLFQIQMISLLRSFMCVMTDEVVVSNPQKVPFPRMIKLNIPRDTTTIVQVHSKKEATSDCIM